jgi:hypothetical protein
MGPFPQVLFPLRYQRRWARRLHQDYGFSREDAQLLSLATFGTDLPGRILGVDIFVTFDLRLLDRFTANYSVIERRFSRMTSHLPSPYIDAVLPEVATPGEVLRLLSTAAT